MRKWPRVTLASSSRGETVDGCEGDCGIVSAAELCWRWMTSAEPRSSCGGVFFLRHATGNRNHGLQSCILMAIKTTNRKFQAAFFSSTDETARSIQVGCGWWNSTYETYLHVDCWFELSHKLTSLGQTNCRFSRKLLERFNCSKIVSITSVFRCQRIYNENFVHRQIKIKIKFLSNFIIIFLKY